VCPRGPQCASGACSHPQSRHRSRRTGIGPESLALLTPSSLPGASDAARVRARALAASTRRSPRSYTSRSTARAHHQTIHSSVSTSSTRSKRLHHLGRLRRCARAARRRGRAARRAPPRPAMRTRSTQSPPVPTLFTANGNSARDPRAPHAELDPGRLQRCAALRVRARAGRTHVAEPAVSHEPLHS
jgi:hypothetical protein